MMHSNLRETALTLLLGAVPLATLTVAAVMSFYGKALPAEMWILAGGCVPALLSPPSGKSGASNAPSAENGGSHA